MSAFLVLINEPTNETMAKKVKKVRVDELVMRLELCDDIETARRQIMAGEVRSSADHVLSRPSDLIPEDTPVFIKSRNPYVSRGAYKLIPALDKHLPDLTGLTTLDVGASTGGFTDLMLQRDAKHSYTVDVGHGVLHAKIRNDVRVTCFERVNARDLPEDFLPEKVDVAVTDVSFISVTKVLPSMDRLTKLGGWLFILVKPQFEARRSEIMGGVVRDKEVQHRCVEEVKAFGQKLGWNCYDCIASPLKGPKGNQEYILCFRK